MYGHDSSAPKNVMTLKLSRGFPSGMGDSLTAVLAEMKVPADIRKSASIAMQEIVLEICSAPVFPASIEVAFFEREDAVAVVIAGGEGEALPPFDPCNDDSGRLSLARTLVEGLSFLGDDGSEGLEILIALSDKSSSGDFVDGAESGDLTDEDLESVLGGLCFRSTMWDFRKEG